MSIEEGSGSADWRDIFADLSWLDLFNDKWRFV